MAQSSIFKFPTDNSIFVSVKPVPLTGYHLNPGYGFHYRYLHRIIWYFKKKVTQPRLAKHLTQWKMPFSFTYLVLHILHLVLHISFTKVFCEGNPRMEFFPYAVLKCHAFLVIFLVGQQRKQLKFWGQQKSFLSTFLWGLRDFLCTFSVLPIWKHVANFNALIRFT